MRLPCTPVFVREGAYAVTLEPQMYRHTVDGPIPLLLTHSQAYCTLRVTTSEPGDYVVHVWAMDAVSGTDLSNAFVLALPPNAARSTLDYRVPPSMMRLRADTPFALLVSMFGVPGAPSMTHVNVLKLVIDIRRQADADNFGNLVLCARYEAELHVKTKNTIAGAVWVQRRVSTMDARHGASIRKRKRPAPSVAKTASAPAVTTDTVPPVDDDDDDGETLLTMTSVATKAACQPYKVA